MRRERIRSLGLLMIFGIGIAAVSATAQTGGNNHDWCYTYWINPSPVGGCSQDCTGGNCTETTDEDYCGCAPSGTNDTCESGNGNTSVPVWLRSNDGCFPSLHGCVCNSTWGAWSMTQGTKTVTNSCGDSDRGICPSNFAPPF